MERVAAGPAVVETAGVAPVPGLGEVMADEMEVPLVVEHPPARDRLGREAAVGEGDHQRRVSPQHPADIAQKLDRPRQILHRDADRRAVELAVAEGQARLGVEVLDMPFVEKRVFG